MFFRIVAHCADNFPCCGPEREKIIGVVAYTADKWSAMLGTTLKNSRIRITPRIETICEFTPGFPSDVFHEES
jgi:hypothetical protein